MNEFDELEDIYFGKKQVGDKMERAKLRGLYEYCWMLNPPKAPRIHVPYNLMTYLAKVAPKGNERNFINEMLKKYGMLRGEIHESLEDRVQYALNWVGDFEEISQKGISLEPAEVSAIKDLIEFMKGEVTEDEIQSAIFNIARKNALQPGTFFRRLYQILLNMDRGPRLGPYIVAMKKENVIDALERAVKKPKP